MRLIKEIAEHYLLSSLTRLHKIIHSPKSHKRVVICQKNGKERTVFVPCKSIKLAQKYVLEKYLTPINYSEYAYAYTKGRSIVDMTSVHIGNSYFLHIDVKHFFDSMRWSTFKDIVLNHYADSELAELIKEDEKELRFILTFRRLFRQGSITSPYVSNIYLKEFDDIMGEYVDKNLKDGKYTRYSDDIYISSSEFIKNDLIEFIKKNLHKYGLRINYEKISLRRLKDSVSIVGLSLLSEGDIAAKTSFKKKTKSLVYNAIKNKGNKTNFNVLYGHLYFLMMVDPVYFNVLQNKYRDGEILMMDLIKNIEKERTKNKEE